MKNIILIIFITLSICSWGQNKVSQIIINEVAISPYANIEFQNKRYDNPKDSYQIYMDQLRYSSISVMQKDFFLSTIFKKIQEGSITVYEADLYQNYIYPEKYFKTPIPKEIFRRRFHAIGRY